MSIHREVCIEKYIPALRQRPYRTESLLWGVETQAGLPCFSGRSPFLSLSYSWLPFPKILFISWRMWQVSLFSEVGHMYMFILKLFPLLCVERLEAANRQLASREFDGNEDKATEGLYASQSEYHIDI